MATLQPLQISDVDDSILNIITPKKMQTDTYNSRGGMRNSQKKDFKRSSSKVGSNSQMLAVNSRRGSQDKVAVTESQNNQVVMQQNSIHSSDATLKKILRPPYTFKKVMALPNIHDPNVRSEQSTALTQVYQMNDYYNGFLRENFLFENANSSKLAEDLINPKLKQRLQNRAKMNQTVGRAFARTTMQSPVEKYGRGGGSSNRLTEMKYATRPPSSGPNHLSQADTRVQDELSQTTKLPSVAVSPRQEETLENTFFMIDAKDYMNQRRLGEFKLSKQVNVMDKGTLLIDSTKMKQMTSAFIKHNLGDIFTKRKFQQALLPSTGKTTTTSAGGEEIREFPKKWDPDAGLPYYLRDRVGELYNPMKDPTKLTFTEIKCIEKMKRMGKWDEERDGAPNGQQMLRKVDSLVESVYNSEKNIDWAKELEAAGIKGLKAPPPSVMSQSDVNIYDSRSKLGKNESEWQLLGEGSIGLVGEIGTEDSLQQQSIIGGNQQNDSSLAPDNLQQSNLESKGTMDYYSLIQGDDKESPDDMIDSVTIDGIQLASIKVIGPFKVIAKSRDQSRKRNFREPSFETLDKIYQHYCTSVRQVPVRFLQLYNNGWLKLPNFNLQAGISLALACVIPFMTELIGVKLSNNGIKDDEAAYLIRACQFCPKFEAFHLEKNEVGEKFAFMLKEAGISLQQKLAEVSLSQSKNFMKVSAKVSLMTCESYLHHLDLSNNGLSYMATKLLGNLIKVTTRLENLNMSYCNLRNSSAREIANGLFFNQTLKFLNLSFNCFSSKDYELASKLSRIIQIHNSLVHLDLTSIQIKREEAMYIAQCLNDSSNIVCCHLSGNSVDYYSRLYLRSHLNALVQYPLNHHSQHSGINNMDKEQIVALNRYLQMNINDQAGLQIAEEKQNHPDYYHDMLATISMYPGDITHLQNALNETLNKFGQRARRASQLPDEGEESDPIRGRRVLQQESTNENQVQSQDAQQASPQDKNTRASSLAKKNANRHVTTNNIVSVYESNLANPNSKEHTSGDSKKHHKSVPASRGQDRLQRYLRVGHKRIYDMFHMLDTYGFRRLVEEAKQYYLSKFPDTDLAKQFVEEDRKTMKAKSSIGGIQSLNDPFNLMQKKKLSQPQADPATLAKIQQDMYRFISTLTATFDDKLPPHPMTGFLTKLVFTRYIGMGNDVEQGNVWRDSSQCWVCEGWTKARVEYNPADMIEDEQFQRIFEISQQFNEGYQGQKLTKNLGANIDLKKNISMFGRDAEDSSRFANNEYLIRPKDHHRNVNQINLDTKQLENIEITELKDQGYDQLSPLQIKNVRQFQRKIVPDVDTINKQDGIVLHQGCIPYKPFIRKGMSNTQVVKSNGYSDNQVSVQSNYQILSQTQSSMQHSESNDTQTSGVEIWPNEKAQKTAEDLAQIEENKLKYTYHSIFAEWWKFLENQPRSQIEDIYLVASFNNWLPVKMEAWERKQIMLLEPEEIEQEMIKIRDIIKNIELPTHLLQPHLEKKYQLSRNEAIPSLSDQSDETSSDYSTSKLSSEKQPILPTIFKTLQWTKEDEEKYDIEALITDISYRMGRFLPAGKYHFYFIKGGKQFCLSDRYPIRKFKQTNIYMNEIAIDSKEWSNRDFDLGEVTGVRKKVKFDQSKSVFKQFKLENEETLLKMFELDFKYSKIKKIFKTNTHEYEAVKKLMWNLFPKIKNIFLTCTINSEFPIISWNDFTAFCHQCKIPDNKNCNLSTIDRIYIATNVNQNIPGNQGDKDLVRYEFLEIIVRIANAKYKETGVCISSTEAVRKLLEDHLFPHMEESIPQDFRDNHLYTDEVNELILRNEYGIKKLFGLFTHGTKRYMSIKDCVELINTKAELRFLDRQVLKQFGLSKMPHIDAILTPELASRMVYVEFLEFLGRIAFEVFRDHSGMKDEPLHLKYDALLTKLFKIVKFNKAFTFLDLNKQNVIYEVVLNPQLASQITELAQGERIQGFLNSDLEKIQETSVKLNI